MCIRDRLSVTGFDGIAPALAVGLSTVVQPNKAKGAAAGHMLADLIDRAASEPARRAASVKSEESPRKVLRTSFHEGRTVAPPNV